MYNVSNAVAMLFRPDDMQTKKKKTTMDSAYQHHPCSYIQSVLLPGENVLVPKKKFLSGVHCATKKNALYLVR